MSFVLRAVTMSKYAACNPRAPSTGHYSLCNPAASSAPCSDCRSTWLHIATWLTVVPTPAPDPPTFRLAKRTSLRAQHKYLVEGTCELHLNLHQQLAILDWKA